MKMVRSSRECAVRARSRRSDDHRRYDVPCEAGGGDASLRIDVVDRDARRGAAARCAPAPGARQVVLKVVTLEGETGDGESLDTERVRLPAHRVQRLPPVPPTAPAGRPRTFPLRFPARTPRRCASARDAASAPVTRRAHRRALDPGGEGGLIGSVPPPEPFSQRSRGPTMSFRQHLQDVCERVEGAVACSLMAVDGIEVETHARRPRPRSTPTLLVEYSGLCRIGERRGAADQAGEVDELSVSTEKLTAVARVVSPEYFLIVALRPGGEPGQGALPPARHRAEGAGRAVAWPLVRRRRALAPRTHFDTESKTWPTRSTPRLSAAA